MAEAGVRDQAGQLARWYEFRFGWSHTRRIGPTPWTFDVRVIVLGWWLRFIWGVTFKPERFRWRKFYGHRLLALRLWGKPFDSRLVGIQWRRADRGPMGRLVA